MLGARPLGSVALGSGVGTDTRIVPIGVSATGHAGSPSNIHLTAISGVAATANAGSIIAKDVEAPIGVAVTANAGSPLTSETVSLPGASAVIVAGSMGVPVANPVPPGVIATGQAGGLALDISPSPIGVEAIGEAAFIKVWHKAQVVISDLKIRSTEITDTLFQQELENGGMAGWADWKSFLAGDYQLQKGAIRYVLRALGAPRPTIPTSKVVVDVPDINDRGTFNVTVTDGTYQFVAFDRTFTSTAEMQVAITPIAGTKVATPELQPTGAFTTTGFYMRLRAGDGTFVAGTISWVAVGY